MFFWFIILFIWICFFLFIIQNYSDFKNVFLNLKFDENAFQEINDSWFLVCKDNNFNLTPNCETYPISGVGGLGTYYIKINSDGFRGRDYTLEKPENTFRIIVLGDSFTFGFGLDIEKTFPYIFEEMLNRGFSKTHYEVLNFGLPGANTAVEVNFLKEKGLKYDPDLVIIGFLHNDDETLDFLKKIETYKRGQEQHLAYQSLKDNPKFKGIEFIKGYFEEMESLSKENSFNILVYAFDIEKYQEEFFKELERSSKNIYFQKASFDYNSNKKYYLHHLDHHPSPLSHELYAKEIYEIIKQNNLIR